MTGKSLMMTAPVIASRCPVFAPSCRQGRTDWRMEGKWGSVSVVGEITQIHRGILDAIFAHALDTREMHTGAVEVLVDPYTISKITHSSRDYKWLADKRKSILRDMQVAQIEIVEPDGRRHVGGIVSEWRESTRRVPLPGGAMTGDRPLLAITISAAWMRLHRSTLAIDYRDLIPAIASLKSGVLQALVRFCLTHRMLNMSVDDVLAHIGAIDSTTTARTARRVIKTVHDADLSIFGIQVKNRAVHYQQNSLVRFKNPEAATTCAEAVTTCAGEDTTCAGSQEYQELQELLILDVSSTKTKPRDNPLTPP